MKPGVAASLVIFIIYGLIFTFDHDFKTIEIINDFLMPTIWISAGYFYYLNIVTEGLWEKKRDQKKDQRFHWWLIMLQYIGFYLLWFLLRLPGGIIWYAILILFLNLTYLVYDIRNKEKVFAKFEGKIMFLFDLTGFVFSIWLLSCVYDLPPDKTITNYSNEELVMLARVTGSSTAIMIQSGLGFFVAVIAFWYWPFKYIGSDGKIIKKIKS